MSPAVGLFLAHAPAVALKVSLLLALVALADRLLLSRRSAAARHLAWTLGVAASLALPLVLPFAPAWDVAIPAGWVGPGPVAGAADPAREPRSPASAPRNATVRAPAHEAASPAVTRRPGADVTRDGVSAAVPAPVSSASASESTPPPPWGAIVAVVYLLGASLLLARVALERGVVARIASGAKPVTDLAWTRALTRCAARVGVSREVTLLQGGRTTVPLMWGLARPHVLLPVSAAHWPAERREAVLLHELAHVARGDCISGLLGALACALYWPVPLVWLASHRLRVERELACDDVVLSGGIAHRAYASHLLAIAREGGMFRAPAALAVSMAAPSGLESRMRAALDATRHRRAPCPSARRAAAMLAAAALLPLAAVRGVAAEESTRADGRATRAGATGEMRHDTAPRTQPPAALRGGTWYMRRASGGEAVDGGASAHVMLETRGLNTFVVPIARLEGLTADAFTNGGARRFTLRQDAGTLTFDGTFAGGTGNGRFTFQPDSGFVDELARRGMARPTLDQLFTLGIHGEGLPLLDALSAEGYRQPTTAELVSLSLTGVDAERVRAMAALGYRLGTASALVSLHNQGIDPGFVRRANAEAGRTLTPGELRAVRRGARLFVRADSARTGSRSGAPGVPPALVADSLVPRRSPPDHAGTAAAPGASATPTEGRWTLTSTRAGLQLELFWSDSTNWRRDITAEELRSLDPSALSGGARSAVTFHTTSDAGRLDFDGTVANGRGAGDFRFTANRGFVATLRALGVTDVDDVSDHDLKNLTYAGVGANTVRELQRIGYARIGWEELLHFAIRLATPQYASVMRAARVEGAETVEGVAALRHLGVSSFTVSEFARSGLTGLSADDIRLMARAGVTPEFVRILRAGGITGLTVDQLIERRQGAARR